MGVLGTRKLCNKLFMSLCLVKIKKNFSLLPLSTSLKFTFKVCLLYKNTQQFVYKLKHLQFSPQFK